MPRTTAVALAVVVFAAVPRSARADIQVRGPEVYPGKSEVSAHLGFQSGIANYNWGGGPPAGFRLGADYNFRFYDAGTFTLWLNVGFMLTVGGGCSAGAVPFNGAYGCGGFATGDEIEPMAGVKLKFHTPIPLVPYARLDAIFSYIFNRYGDDNGYGVGGRAAGGAKYFLTRNIGVGLETGITLGGAIFPYGCPSTSVTCFRNGYTYDGSRSELYAAFDFLLGGEFAFNNL